MVQITTFVLAAVALAGQALAIDCVSGQYYCGYYLLSGSGADRVAWLKKINDALAASGKPNNPPEGTWQSSSLFQCRPGNQIVWDAHCPSANGLQCHNPSNNICGGTNYCCAP